MSSQEKCTFYRSIEHSTAYLHVSYIPGICNFVFLRAGGIYTHAFFNIFICKAHVQRNKEGKDQESIQSSTTPDPGYHWESDNVTIRHHK